jgi:hypothetical protein
MSHPRRHKPLSSNVCLLLLQRLGCDSQAPGRLRVEARRKFAMRPLPVGEPRLEALRPFRGAPQRPTEVLGALREDEVVGLQADF